MGAVTYEVQPVGGRGDRFRVVRVDGMGRRSELARYGNESTAQRVVLLLRHYSGDEVSQ